MQRRIVLWLGAVGLAATPLLFLVAAWTLGRAGSCVAQMRSFSDEEKIEAAADYARRGFHVSFPIRSTSGLTTEIVVRTPVYASAADFLAANPGCCRMAGPGNPADLLHPDTEAARRPRPEQNVVVVDMAVPFDIPGGGGRQTATLRTNIAIHPCGVAETKRIFKRVAYRAVRLAFG